MNKLRLTSGIWILAMSAGLIGCEKAKKEIDVYRVNPPKVVKAGDPVEFRAFSDNSERELDIQDQFDVSDGSPAKTEITADCQSRDHAQSLTVTTDGHPDIKVFSLVPEFILVGKFEQEIKCSFTFTLSNAAGSRHIFSLPATKIVDRLSSVVKISFGDKLIDSTSNNFFLDDTKLNETFVRFANQGSGTTSVACDFVVFPAVPFNKVLTFNDLNLTKGDPRPLSEPQGIGAGPYQSCRVIIANEGRRIGVSPAFTYTPKLQSLTVTQEPRPALSDYSYQILWNDYIEPQKPYPYSTVILNNVTGTSRTVRIAKELEGAELLFYLANYVDRQRYHFPAKGYVTVNPSPRSTLTQDADYFYLTIPSGDFASMSASILPREAPRCFQIKDIPTDTPKGGFFSKSVMIDPSLYRDWGYGFAAATSGRIDELNAFGGITKTLTFSWGEPLAIPQYSLIDLDGYRDVWELQPPCAFEVIP